VDGGAPRRRRAGGGAVGSQFPALRDHPVRLLAEGWDNTVHLVGGTWAFRFPRRQVALPGVLREIDLLPRLAALLPVAVPVPELVGNPAGDYPWPFFGARLLPGRELADSHLPDDARTPLGAAVGSFLRALHRPEVARGLGSSLPSDPMCRALPAARAPMTRERLSRLANRGTWAPDGEVSALLDGSLDLGSSTVEPVLVHGDLHLRHLLVDEHGAASGVIDWGDLCLADPSVDLSVAHSAFSGAARNALLTAYGHPVGPEQETRARVLAVSLCAALADYADTDARPALLAESLAGLRRAVG